MNIKDITKNKTIRLTLASVLLILGLLLVTLGVRAEENRTIQNKGGTVCLECIGIG